MRLLNRSAAIVATLVCLFSLRVAAQEDEKTQRYSSLHAFGDSLVDAGNFSNLASPSASPPSPPYAQKFSNGSVWVEVLADELALSPVLSSELLPNVLPSQGANFAVAGSLSSDTNVNGERLPGLQRQIEFFSQYAPVLPSSADALFVMLVGGNDYNEAIVNSASQPVAFDALPDQVTDNIIQALSNLIDLGAEHLLVANLPDLGQQPLIQQLNQLNSDSASILTALSTQHNQLLNQKLAALSKASGAKITRLDLNDLFKKVAANPKRFGFTNTEDPCLTNFRSGFIFEGVCDDPNEFLFWDDAHPTAAMHEAIAQLAIDTLETPDEDVEDVVLVPYTVLPLLVLGGVFVFVRSRTHKKVDSLDASKE